MTPVPTVRRMEKTLERLENTAADVHAVAAGFAEAPHVINHDVLVALRRFQRAVDRLRRSIGEDERRLRWAVRERD